MGYVYGAYGPYEGARAHSKVLVEKCVCLNSIFLGLRALPVQQFAAKPPCRLYNTPKSHRGPLALLHKAPGSH